MSKAELLYSPLGSMQSGSAANQLMPLNALIYKGASQPRRLRPIQVLPSMRKPAIVLTEVTRSMSFRGDWVSSLRTALW
jgi:hypothetical protein